MSMLTIGGTAVSPNPSTFQVGVMDITEAVRNGNGDMIADRLSTKRKIELSWKYVTNAEMSTLLSLFTASFFVSVTYPDPVTGANRTGTFYVGDRTQGAFKYNINTSAIIGWKDVKFNLIER